MKRYYIRNKSKESKDEDRSQIPNGRATAYVVLTVAIMEYSYLFSIYPIVLLYALWFPYLFYRGRFTPHISKDVTLSYVLVAVCIGSTLWSAYPEVTIHAGCEFATMVICAVIIARMVSVESFIVGLAIGASGVLVSTLIDGTYAQDYFTGTYSLVGKLGSKNQVGFIAEAGFLASGLYLLAKNGFITKIFFAIVPLIVCSIGLVFSHSATSYVSLAVALVSVCAVCLISRFTKHSKSVVSFLCLLCIGCAVAAMVYGGGEKTLFASLGKNSTLTGRTYLWQEGARIGQESPLLGQGYNAFWVPGQPQAERYWEQFRITLRSGFHFHSIFVQSFIDLGALGLSLIILLLLMSCYKSFVYLIENPLNLKGSFCLGVSIMLLVRAFVEVDFLGIFGLGELLFYSILPRLVVHGAKSVTEKADAPFLWSQSRFFSRRNIEAAS